MTAKTYFLFHFILFSAFWSLYKKRKRQKSDTWNNI